MTRRYRENARQIAEKLAAAPGPAGAADHIEALANDARKAAQPLAAEGSVR